MTLEGRMISTGIIRDGLPQSHLPAAKPSKLWKKIGLGIGAIFGFLPGILFALGSGFLHGITWVKRNISLPNHLQYKKSIQCAILSGFKEAAMPLIANPSKVQTLQNASPETRTFVEKVKQFAKKIDHSKTDASMDEIDQLTDMLSELSHEFLDTGVKNELDPESEKMIFDFLRLSAKARIIPDGKEATLSYGQKKIQKHGSLASHAQDFASQWERSLNNSIKVHRNNKIATAHWGLGNPKKAWHSHQSESDGRHSGKIVYDALQGNPSFIAHEVDGIQFVHSPTPSAPNESPVFRMYLEQLKVEGKRHLHFQFQSPHAAVDFARIQQMDRIAQSYKDTFQQVVLSFDALESPEGQRISDQFIKGNSDVNGFFDAYQRWAMQNIRKVDSQQPITIPESFLSDAQIRIAFETAKAICLDADMDLSNPKSREEFTHVMQNCLYGVLMTAITNTQKNKQSLFVSGGCKQDVDRGPVLNLIMKFFSILLSKDTLDDKDVAEMHATASGRAQIGDHRHILKKRAIHGVNFLKFVGDAAHQAAVAHKLRNGIGQIQNGPNIAIAEANILRHGFGPIVNLKSK